MTGLARFSFVQTLICRTGSELKHRATTLGFEVMETRHPLLGHAEAFKQLIGDYPDVRLVFSR